MTMPYIGEIRMFAGNFAPAGWSFCDGSLLAISENDTLFNLIGTTYGGDGMSTFALPDLRGRIPIHVGAGFVLAQSGGSETVTLTTSQLPGHNHVVQTVAGGSAGNAKSTPAGNFIADENLPSPLNPQPFAYASYANANQRTLGGNSIQNTGGSQPHDNMVPFLAVSFIISLYGVYPSPT